MEVIIGVSATIIVALISTWLTLRIKNRDETHLPPPKPHRETSSISLARLPSMNPELFGREDELADLNLAWDTPTTRLVSVVAWGGVGKSGLVSRWLQEMDNDDFRGADKVYGWSFYSQGAGEDRQDSADEFLAVSLEWFGDDNPDEGLSWDKGLRLAKLVQDQRTLLILDGLEPLQNPPGDQEGKLKDHGLQSLLKELAHRNPGLCVITTRLAVDDIKEFVGDSHRQIDLDELSVAAGSQLLEHLGVKGDSTELADAVGQFAGHAMALMLLGTLLRDAYGGDIRRIADVGPLQDDPRQGGHARRVMESYERSLGEGRELAILRLLGLFDRPAPGAALDVLRAAPLIPGLTNPLSYRMNKGGLLSCFRKSEETPLNDRDWAVGLQRLRHARLLSARDPGEPDALDCHPLVREHFGEKLKRDNPEAWREAHGRLYQYYQSVPEKDLPDTLEEMAPLYAAVRHGCEAELYQDALEEVYYRRVRRGQAAFNVKMLGAFGTSLAMISGYFQQRWSQPVAEMTEADRGFVLGQAGFTLRALGRLGEAIQPMKAGLDYRMGLEDWLNASMSANNLSELNLIIGNLTDAMGYAQQAVDLADRSGDVAQRMIVRTTLADTQHQAGMRLEGETLFREAEKMQMEWSQQPVLYSVQGFQYCDLLLDQGKYSEVQERADQTIEIAQRQHCFVDIGLDHVSLGRSSLLQALQEGTSDLTVAENYLALAVDGLRRAGVQDQLPLGLLARGELYRAKEDFEAGQMDVDEANSIAQRGGMRLRQADCHLAYARLYLAMGDKSQAREHLATVTNMVSNMGYHRRDPEVKELAAQLGVGEVDQVSSEGG